MALANSAFAQEETSTLPRGIFRTWVIGAVGGSDFQYDGSGRRQELTHKLNRSVTIHDFEKALAAKPETRAKSEDLKKLHRNLDEWGKGLQIEDFGNQLFQADIYAKAQVQASQLVYALEYGFTSNLSAGIALPLVWYDIQAKIKVQTRDSFARTNNKFKGLKEISQGISDFTKTKEIQNLQAFKESLFTKNGYEIPSNTKVFGIGDVEGGFKYRAFESTYVDSALLLGFRLPTASHKKDPSKLLDQATGDGQFDLAFQGALDFKLRPNLIFLTAAKYTYQSPDYENVVGPIFGSDSPLPDLNDPRVRDKNARRKLGDLFDVNLNLRYSMFQKRFTVVSAYLFQHKFADSYSGDSSTLNYAELEKNTMRESHAAELYLIYSTVADYMRKEKAIPWEASVTYHHTLSGLNIPDTNYAFARVKFFFN